MSELKIKAGLYYKTRDGRKAFVAAVATPEQVHTPDCRAAGWCEGVFRTWMENGSYYPSGNSPHDLIEEWREPLTDERIIYLFPYGVSLLKTGLTGNPIGSARVKLVEGVFAE